MATQSQHPVRVAFGPFEVNAATGEIRRSGIRLRLPTQPFQILLLLLAHPGEVVTREQVREQIWGKGTFIDFEHGLNAAINKLRRALGDSAENPRYIETIPGRGYRFMGILEHPLPASTTPPVASEPNGSSEPQLAGVRPVSARTVEIVAAAACVAFGVWGVVAILTNNPAPIERPVLQFTISPPQGTVFSPPVTRQPFAISPDGTRLAFTATTANGTNIWLRNLASLDAQPVPGTENAWGLFWSPDSRSLFYSVRSSLKEANLVTGSTHSVARLPYHALFGSWRRNGNLLLDLGPPDFYELAMEDGSLRKLPHANMRWAEFLPGGDSFIHIAFDPALARYRTFVTNYATGKSLPLMEADSRVEYAPPLRRGEDGELLYVRGSSLLAQPFDAPHLQLAGDPFPISQNVIYFRPSASACFSVSDNGVLVYQAPFPISELNWYNRFGHLIGAVAAPAAYYGPVRISPDGREVAATTWTPENGGIDIWMFSASRKEKRRLTYAPETHSRLVWSPDGKRLAFGESVTAAPAIATLDLEKSGNAQKLAAGAGAEPPDLPQLPTDWSPDARYIVFDTGLGEEEQQIWIADTVDRKILPLLHGESAQWGAVFSPDGKRLAFISTESGRPEVYVQPFKSLPAPGVVGEKRQISRNSAWIARWRPDGRELFYVDTDNWLYEVSAKGPLQFTEPKPLFRIPGIPPYGTTSDFQFDVTRDGQRFVMTTIGSVPPPPFTVVENWQTKFHR